MRVTLTCQGILELSLGLLTLDHLRIPTFKPLSITAYVVPCHTHDFYRCHDVATHIEFSIFVVIQNSYLQHNNFCVCIYFIG